MHHIDLLPIFIIVILINIILLGVSVMNEVRHRNAFGKLRFYPNLILLFIWWAYSTRGFYLIYIVSQYPQDDFNRSVNNEYDDMLRVYFNHLPNMFYGLAAVAYLIKWIAEYYEIPINSNFDEQAAAKAQCITKTTWVGISVLTIILFIICLETNMDKTTFRIWTSCLFFVPCVGLQLTSRAFLRQLKKYDYAEYELKHKGVKIITLSCSILIFIKGISILATFFHYNFYDIEDETGHESIHMWFDILLITNYFVESMPSMIMFLVRWRQLREIVSFKVEQSRYKSLDSINTTTSSNNASRYKLSYVQNNALGRSRETTFNVNKTLLKTQRTDKKDEFKVLYDDRNEIRSDYN